MFSTLFLCLLMTVALTRTLSINEQWQSLWNKNGRSTKLASSSTNVVPETDIRSSERRIWIITTACLPWMTGTSINPLLRAAYLSIDRPPGKVTLLVPWLEVEDQNSTYPPSVRFSHPSQQEKYVREWLTNQANLPIAAERLDIRFYAGRYHDEFHSIFAMGDITDLIPDDQADFCVLEEPEHLNWYRAPFTTKAWTEKFKHVVGIMHTNYLVYARTISAGFIKEPFLYIVNKAMCRAYCHKVIKLSNALQEFAPEKEVTSNVHGVREHFLRIGDSALAKGFSKGAYFVGKLVWPKGLDKLFDLMKVMKAQTGKAFPIDIYGQGPHSEEMKEVAKKAAIDAVFHGGKDHAQLTDFRVFVNPSISEVLCTTIVEALAMGKWVVCAKHPSNEFFEQFPNCLIYRTAEEFSANVVWALNNDPAPLTPDQRFTLSWQAATERFIQASAMTEDEYQKSHHLSNKFSLWLHDAVVAGAHGDAIRNVAGAKGASNQVQYMKQYGSANPRPLNIHEDEFTPTEYEKSIKDKNML